MNQEAVSNSAQAVALFVFIPFCKIKCTYCDFNAYANMGRLTAPYTAALETEIRRSGTNLRRVRPAKTLYFGGGTPSTMPAEDVARIIRACDDSFNLTSGAEITLEMNPGTADLAKFRAWRGMGINRLSLGIQSFDDVVLRRLNRGHNVSDALKSIDWARQSAFENLNLDLIYGLPLQTQSDWIRTLERAIEFSPEHLSLYGLQVEEGTGLEYQIRHAKFPRPDDGLTADMYEYAEERLEAAGYEHYEISNWARHSGDSRTRQLPATLRSRHNLTYWHNEPYLGFGAGAHSSFGGARFWNVLAPAEYIQRTQEGQSAEDGREVIDRDLAMSETIILGLRLKEGVSYTEFRSRFGSDPRERYEAALRETREQGLIEMTEESVRLTARGRLLSNQVFWRLLP